MLDQIQMLSFAVHGGEGFGGGVGLLSAVLDGIGGWVSLPADEKFSALLPGVAVMQNWHPLAVHFPIALLTFFVFMELVNLIARRDDYHHFASGMLYLGTISAAVTVALGLIAAASVAHDGETHELMESHEHLAIALLILAVLLSIWRYTSKQRLQGGSLHFFTLMTALLALLLILTADLGGAMVYGHGVAVAPMQEINEEANDEHDHHEEHEHHHDAE